jgi:type IV pilus assembly protein PilB
MLNRIRRKRFGEILVGEGLISKEQLDEALQLQKASGDFLGNIIIDMGQTTESDIVRTLSVQYQLPFLRPALYDIDRRLLDKFKPEFLHLHKVLPIDKIGNLLLLLVTDIPGDDVLAEIQEVAESNLAIYIGPIGEVDTILRETMPIDEEQEAAIRQVRKGVMRSTSAATAQPVEEMAAVKKGAAAAESDSSWESIFDEAEEKVNENEE